MQSHSMKPSRPSRSASLTLPLTFLALLFSSFVALQAPAQDLTERIVTELEDATEGGVVGVYLREIGGEVLASSNATFAFYPASTIKITHHLHAMRGVEDAGNPLDLETPILVCMNGFNCGDGPNETNCPRATISRELESVLLRMMKRSTNEDPNALQDFFGDGTNLTAEVGRSAINQTSHEVGGMSDATSMEHKFACGNVDNDPYNTATLEDFGRLYERIATDRQVVEDFDRFRSLMLSEADRSLTSELMVILEDQIAAAGLDPDDSDIAAIGGGMKQAHKAGNVTNDGRDHRSIAGWVELPPVEDPETCNPAARPYVFGIFVDDVGSGGISNPKLRELAAELFRDPLRDAVEDVRCARPPVGAITSPADCQCFGPTSLPVTILDDFQDSCTADLTRTYDPSDTVFSQHGDHAVSLSAGDACANRVEDEIFFTIDLVQPQLEVSSPLATTYTQPDDLPIPILLSSLDLDGARGGVVYEEIRLDGELLYDGSTFGDADGRLSDEVSAAGGPLAIGLGELCASGPGLDGQHQLTVIARDCGGNTTTRSVAFAVDLPGKKRCDDAVPHLLVVNEVDYDQGDDDDGEFVEIKNVGTQSVRLADYALRTYYFAPLDSNPNFGRYERYPMADAMLAPGDYFVVCTADNDAIYCDQHVEPTGWGYQVPELLREESPATVSLVYNPTGNKNFDRLVDSVCYIGSETPGDPGFGVPGNKLGGPLTEVLCNTQIETEPGAGVSRVPDGLDRDSNIGDLRQACITPKEPNAASVADCSSGGEALGRLVINELDVNQPQHPDASEFVEIVNVGDTPVRVEDYVLIHRYLDQAQSFYPKEVRLRLSGADLPTGGLLPPGLRLIACRNEFPFAPCVANPLFPLHDTAGVVALVHNTTGDLAHDRLVDSVAYGTPNAAFDGGPAGGGLWVEGLPIAEADGTSAVDGIPGTGFSRLCDGADSDDNASDFVLAPTTPGTVNAQP